MNYIVPSNLVLALRDAATSDAKRAAWAAIRANIQTAGINLPRKLGIETNPRGAFFAAPYEKDSTPRRYLQVLTRATSAAFAVADTPTVSQWYSINKQDLLDLLRDDHDGFTDRATLPAGFPQNLSTDAIVLDPATGTLYFTND